MPEPKHNMDRKTWDTVANFHRPVEKTVPDITPEHEAGWAQSGWSPEAIEMIKRLHAAGLPIKLAAVAAKDLMGLNSGPPTPEQEWDAYARENPGKATAKKLLVKGGEIVKGATKPIWGSKDLMQEAEKMSAAKMLQEYLQAQDAQRAGQMQKEQLWMLARQPGQYMGPTTPTENNQVFAAQDNAIYQAQNKRR